MRFEKIISSLAARRKPLLAVLIDPDKYNPEVIKAANKSNVSCFLVGGSRLEKGEVHKTIRQIKKLSSLPVLIFPGDETQLSAAADGLLLLSLLSGRDPDYLIGKHIKAAPVIRKMGLRYLSTAYLLIKGGSRSTTEKVTRTVPLDPADIKQIVNTAIAAEQLGFKAIYLEAGSGAARSVPVNIIRRIRKEVSLPLIVGGGIDSRKKASEIISAGANMVVVGNALEKNVFLLPAISEAFET
jgi:phosphoglycerol geranylgeranyltransferase